MNNITTTINVPVLARVEGEGALHIQIKDNHIEALQLRIYEPPRLFEKFLEGRSYEELLDLVARICGICPVAYQMTAAYAIENLFAVNSGSWVREMRRLFYCGEWLSSHSLHIHFLAAPDFLGYTSAITMAKDYPLIVRRGMQLQSLGNKIIKLLGARSVHPVGACIGGFYKAPSNTEVDHLLDELQFFLPDAFELVKWVATLPLPQEEQKFICVSLSHPSEYPMNEGRIISDNGLNIPITEFEQDFHQHQVPYSTSLHCTLNGEPYLVGPLSRLNLNYSKLPNQLKEVIEETCIKFPTKNMFYSIVARAIEICYSIIESIRILKEYQVPNQSFIKVLPIEGVAYGATEAPRGLLWQQYKLTAKGLIKSAKIVSPTSQNQYRIEENLRTSLEAGGLKRDPELLREQGEIIIRNYDPCISCATHFLNLYID